MANKDQTALEPSDNEPSEAEVDDTKDDKDFDPPKEPTPEEIPDVLVAPAAIAPDAVGTVETSEGDKKVGWQQEPSRPELLAEPCFHTAIVQARKQVPAFDVGHEWVCTCGTIFVVHINRGGKKTLVEKEALVDTGAEGLNVG